MIINPYQLVQTRFTIITYRTLFSYKLKSVSLEKSDQFTEFHYIELPLHDNRVVYVFIVTSAVGVGQHNINARYLYLMPDARPVGYGVDYQAGLPTATDGIDFRGLSFQAF